MTDLRTAAKAALEALEQVRDAQIRRLTLTDDYHATVAALKAALAQQAEPEQEWNIPKEFNDWWDSDKLTQTNPYREDSAAYWAWEGWQAHAALAQQAKPVCAEFDKPHNLQSKPKQPDLTHLARYGIPEPGNGNPSF